MSDMYEEMTEKNINPLCGGCSHKCSYCYVETLKQRFPNMKKKYSGPPRIDKKVLSKNISGGTRFLCSCTDLFANDVRYMDITRILLWASQMQVTWWIQTKNPNHQAFRGIMGLLESNFKTGITLETNWPTEVVSNAPNPIDRLVVGVDYITIEPIMMFDLEKFIWMIEKIDPHWINIGADSGNNGLPEPSEDDILQLIKELRVLGYDVRLKPNLERLAPSLFQKDGEN